MQQAGRRYGPIHANLPPVVTLGMEDCALPSHSFDVAIEQPARALGGHERQLLAACSMATKRAEGAFVSRIPAKDDASCTAAPVGQNGGRLRQREETCADLISGQECWLSRFARP